MRAILLAFVLAGPAAAEDAPAIGGIGMERCAAILGPDNLQFLAQAADWSLGYMAGRVDGGAVPVEGTTRSAASGLDLVTALTVRCADAPEAAIVEALRDYASGLFGAGAEGGEVVANPAPPPPDPPPDDLVGPAFAPPPRPDIIAAAEADTATTATTASVRVDDLAVTTHDMGDAPRVRPEGTARLRRATPPGIDEGS